MMNLASLILGFFIAVPAVAEFQVPATPNPVNDYAKVLTRGGKELIAKSLVTLKQDTGAQFGVLIVDSLDGSSIEDASFRTATQWKLGSQDKDDGVLLFIAVKDRKIRLEIGKGLEGILTDYRSKQITAKMRAPLKSGDYDGAILVAVGGISEAIKAHNQEITSKSGSTGTTTSEDSTGLNIFVGFLVLFGLGGLAATYVTIRNKRREQERESRRLARQPQTPEQREMSRLMYKDVSKRAIKDPGFPKPEKKSRDEDDDSFTTGVVVGSLLSSGNGHKSSSDDDGGSSFGGGSSDSGGSSFGGSDFGGGGGDFGGGGSSDSF